MSHDPHNMHSIPRGTLVVARNGEILGTVRETHDHYLLVQQEGQHNDLDIPAHAIQGMAGGRLQLTTNRSALTEVDHEETVHHQHHDPEQ